jgi:hypothetical protein
MTAIGCQIFLYGWRSAARTARPLAAGCVPAARVAVPARTSSALLGWEWSPAGLASSRLGNISHESSSNFSVGIRPYHEIKKRGCLAVLESRLATGQRSASSAVVDRAAAEGTHKLTGVWMGEHAEHAEGHKESA